MTQPSHDRVSAAISLQTVSAALAGALTPMEVAAATLYHGAAGIGADAGVVALLHPDDEVLEVLESIGYPEDLFAEYRSIPLSSRVPLADALRSGEPLLFESREQAVAVYPELAAFYPQIHVHAWANLPLLLPGRGVGVLELSFRAPRTFGAEDRALLGTLAQLCAQALERARLYDAERHARKQAEAAVRLRDLFLSVAAHELKTPLTSLIGQAQLLQRRIERESAPNDRYLHSVEVVVSQASRLNKMVSALLDFSRIEQGRLSIERAPLDLAEVVRRVIAELQPTLASHSLIVDDGDAPGGLPIEGDALRLEQVLQNLLSNAVKYSPGGGTVLVRTERRGHTAVLQIVDRGIGIPAPDVPGLFSRFFRAGNAAATNISGMGIGLYVVKEIVHLHGGTVDVESEEGVGSTFSVMIPLVG